MFAFAHGLSTPDVAHSRTMAGRRVGWKEAEGWRRQNPVLSPTFLLCSLCAAHRWPRDSRSEGGRKGGRWLPWGLHICGKMFSVAFLRLARANIDMDVSCLSLPWLQWSPRCCRHAWPLAWDVQATQQSACSRQLRQLARTGCPYMPMGTWGSHLQQEKGDLPFCHLPPCHILLQTPGSRHWRQERKPQGESPPKHIVSAQMPPPSPMFPPLLQTRFSGQQKQV